MGPGFCALGHPRPHVTRTTALKVDLGYHDFIERGVLEAVVLLLCPPHPGAAQMRRLEFVNCPRGAGIEACVHRNK